MHDDRYPLYSSPRSGQRRYWDGQYFEGEPFSVIGFTIADDRITAIDILSDQARLARLDLTAVLG